jgi:hypothetical protein
MPDRIEHHKNPRITVLTVSLHNLPPSHLRWHLQDARRLCRPRRQRAGAGLSLLAGQRNHIVLPPSVITASEEARFADGPP